MPVYEYICAACNYQFDKLLPITTTQAPPCPKCGGVTEQLMSRVSPMQWGRGGKWN